MVNTPGATVNRLETLPGSVVTIQDFSPPSLFRISRRHHYSGFLAAITIQDFSPPAVTHSFMWKLRALQPQAAKPATSTKHLRTAVGSEESRRKQTCIVTFSYLYSKSEYCRLARLFLMHPLIVKKLVRAIILTSFDSNSDTTNKVISIYELNDMNGRWDYLDQQKLK